MNGERYLSTLSSIQILPVTVIIGSTACRAEMLSSLVSMYGEMSSRGDVKSVSANGSPIGPATLRIERHRPEIEPVGPPGNPHPDLSVSCQVEVTMRMPGHLFGRFSFAVVAPALIVGHLDLSGPQNISMSDGDGPLERCDQLEISFDDRPARRGEETLQIPRAGEPLEVRLTSHGGIALREGSGRDHEITLCKAVADDGRDDVSAVKPVVKGSSVGVSGPEGRSWVGYLLVRSPRGSQVALSTTNGPVRVDSFDGDLTVRTTNGPIALDRVRGTVTARATNGPIKLEADGGQISVDAENGPIAVRLFGGQWQSGRLEARAHNGPLAVDVPAEYRSGVEIESSGHAPWSCRGARDCGAQADDSSTRRVRLGDGPTAVRLSTVNGPVKVHSTDR